MMKPLNHNPTISIGDQAMDWLLRWYCGQPSIPERQAYLHWLKTSPEHIAETLRICRHYSWPKTRKLRLFISNEDLFSNVVELPPSPPLKDTEVFEAEVVRAVRAYPVDTETLVRNARAARAGRGRRRRAR